MPPCLFSELGGRYDHKLDPKNRIAIPSAWRPAEECPVILLEARDQGLPVLKGYSPECFRAYVDEVREYASQISGVTLKDINSFVSRMYSESMPTSINAQGKLLIPKQICERLDLNGEILLAGCRDHFEIWRKELYHEAKERALVALKHINDQMGVF